jgi:hypothetical protein
MSLTVAAPSITDWMSGIGAVLGVIATIAVGVLTVALHGQSSVAHAHQCHL